MNRRELLCGLTAGASLLAGCSNILEDGTTTEQPSTTTTSPPTASTISTSTIPPTAPVPATATKTATHAADTVTETAIKTSKPALIDPSQLIPYTNSVYDYRIMYPSHWSLDDSNTQHIQLYAPTRAGYMQLSATKAVPASASLETVVSIFLTRFSKTFNTVEIQDRKTVTLSNEIPAKEVTVMILGTESNPFLKLQGRFLYAMTDNVWYSVHILIENDAYTRSIERAISTIFESFTITG